MAGEFTDPTLAGSPASVPAAAPPASAVPFGYFESMGHLYRLADPYPTPEMPHGSTEIDPRDMASFMAGEETPWQKAGNIPAIAKGPATSATGVVAPAGIAPAPVPSAPGGAGAPAVGAENPPAVVVHPAAGLLQSLLSGVPQAQAAEAPKQFDPAKFGLGPPVAATAAAQAVAPQQGQAAAVPGGPLDPAKFGLGAPVTPPPPPSTAAAGPSGVLANLGAGGNQAITGALGLPVDVATAVLNLVPHAINAVAGTDIPTIQNPIGGSHSLNQLLGLIGANPEKVQQTGPADVYARALGQGVVGAVAPALGAEAAAGSMAPGIARTVAEHVAASKGLQAVGGATGGVAGQAAEDETPAPYKPLANLAGNLVGAGLGMAAVPAAKAIGVRLPGAPIVSEAARQRVVAKGLRQAVGQAPIETSAVGPLDLAQATNVAPVLGKVDYAEGIPEGQAAAADLRARQRSAVDQAIRDLGGGEAVTRPDSSAQFTRFYRQINDIAGKEANRLWTKPELAETKVNPSAVQQAVAHAEAEIEPELHAAMSPELRAIVGRLSRSKETTMRDLNKIRSDLLKVARGNPDGAQRAMARQLAQGFMDGLEETPELQANPKIKAAYDAARDFSRRMAEMFDDTRSAALLREARGEYTTDESAGAQKFFNLSYGTPEGPRTIAELAAFARSLSHQPLAAAAADGLIDTARGYFAAALADASRLGEGKTFSPAALRDLLSKNLPWIEQSGMFTKDQAQMASDLLDYTRQLDRARELQAQKNAATNRRGEQEKTFVGRIMSPTMRTVTEAASIAAGGAAHGIPGGTLGLVAAYGFDKLVRRAETQLRELMARAVLDPEFAAQLMRRPTAANAARMAPAAASVLQRMEKDADAFRNPPPDEGPGGGGGGAAPQPAPGGGGAGVGRPGNRRTEPTLGPPGAPRTAGAGAAGPGGAGGAGGVAAAEAAPVPTGRAGAPIRALTPNGTAVDVRPEVVEASSLIPSNLSDGRINPAYPQELQPRDRTQAASLAQISSLASKLRPDLLMPSSDATAGAPIVGPTGVVESGNGRVLAISRALRVGSLGPQRAAYLKALTDAGYDVEGMQNPILVSRRTTDLSPADLRKFAIEANDRTTLGMSEAEKARADAQRAASAMPLWRGSTAAAAGNRDFVRAFMGKLSPTERAELAPDGNLTEAGISRINRAVMAHAYGDNLGPALDRFLNSDNEGLKNAAGALQDVAGAWSHMRAEAAGGRIPAGLDATRALGEAVNALAESRRLGRPVSEIVGQADLERPPISAEGAAFLRGFFRDAAMTKPAGRNQIGDFLAGYAAKAEKQTPRIVGDQPKTTPGEILAGEGEALGQAPLLGRRLPQPPASGLGLFGAAAGERGASPRAAEAPALPAGPAHVTVGDKAVALPDAAHRALYEAGVKVLRGERVLDAERQALWNHFSGFVEHQGEGTPFASASHVPHLAADYALEVQDAAQQASGKRLDLRDASVVDPDKLGFLADQANRDHTDYQVVRAPAPARDVHSFDITPAMRKAVGEEGLPLFKAGDTQRLGAPHPVAVQAALDAANKMTGGKVKIELHDPNSDVFTIDFGGHKEQVFGYAMGRLVRAAIEPGKTLQNVSHEVVHALKNLGVIRPREWSMLENAATTEGWIQRYDIAQRYPDLNREQKLEEAIAEHFSQYAAKAIGKPPTWLAGTVDRVRQFFAQVRSALAGKGFKRPEDVFRQMASGKVGARKPGSAAPQRGPTTVPESRNAFEAWRRGYDMGYGGPQQEAR